MKRDARSYLDIPIAIHVLLTLTFETLCIGTSDVPCLQRDAHMKRNSRSCACPCLFHLHRKDEILKGLNACDVHETDEKTPDLEIFETPPGKIRKKLFMSPSTCEGCDGSEATASTS